MVCDGGGREDRIYPASRSRPVDDIFGRIHEGCPNWLSRTEQRGRWNDDSMEIVIKKKKEKNFELAHKICRNNGFGVFPPLHFVSYL